MCNSHETLAPVEAYLSLQKAYTDIREDSLQNAEIVERIKQSIQQAKEGKTKKINFSDEIDELLGL